MTNNNKVLKGKTKYFVLIFSLIALAIFLLVSCPNQPTSFEYEINADGETCTLISCSRVTNRDIVIPEKYENYTVTAIADEAFMETNITSVTIPSTIKTIGRDAFKSCESLKAVYGLENCLSLKEIKVGTFWGCISLETITLPPNLIEIGSEAFLACKSIENIKIPNSVQAIGGCAFTGCASLLQLNFSDSVINIGTLAFAQCHSLKEVTIPPNLSATIFSVFLYCDSLVNINVTANSQNFTSIDGILFDKKTSRLYSYPSGKTSETYMIPNNVYVVENQAFAYNSHLKEITIPKSVGIIYAAIFENSQNLTKINYEGTIKEWQSISKDSDWDVDSADYTIYCTDGQISKDGTVTYR